MKTYQITLTEKQLQLLQRTCEIQSRLLIGQTDHLEDIFTDALARHKYDKENNPDYWNDENFQNDKDWISSTLNDLHCNCWNQAQNQFYGVHYSEESDTLIDIVEVIRHQLWKDMDGEKNTFGNNAYPAFHWNKKEPLIEVVRTDIT